MKKVVKNKYFWPSIWFLILVIVFLFLFNTETVFDSSFSYNINKKIETEKLKGEELAIPSLDTALYDQKMEELANNPAPKIVKPKIDPKTGKEIPIPLSSPNLWPVKTVYPNGGALLPFNRIVAYYGNLYSTKMGVLGEYPEDQMLAKLAEEVKKWEIADPETKVLPALHYIAVTAQGKPGTDGKYRFQMPDKEIDKVLKMAEKINAIVFLDLQVGTSDLRAELPMFEKYLKLPQVHLGIDPEFSMKTGKRPGTVIGTYDATDINYAAEYLAKIVKENNLTPKILIVHRFTEKMVTNYQNIKPLPEVQIVMDMDGWGSKARKLNTYKYFVTKQPVQFAGFKIFYKNDLKEEDKVIFTPEELLKLTPRPIYIQYQ